MPLGMRCNIQHRYLYRYSIRRVSIPGIMSSGGAPADTCRQACLVSYGDTLLSMLMTMLSDTHQIDATLWGMPKIPPCGRLAWRCHQFQSRRKEAKGVRPPSPVRPLKHHIGFLRLLRRRRCMYAGIFHPALSETIHFNIKVHKYE
jgi:hypothetical protein